MIGLMCTDPGQLATALGDAPAGALALAVLQDSAALAREAAMRCAVGALAFADSPVALPGWDVRPLQGAGMAAAFAALGHPSLLIAGDAPSLPVALVELAWAELQGRADAVIVPTPDGGCCLFGLAQPPLEGMEGLAWRLDALRALAQGMRLVELPAWHAVRGASGLPALVMSLEGQAPPGWASLPPWPAHAVRRALTRQGRLGRLAENGTQEASP